MVLGYSEWLKQRSTISHDGIKEARRNPQLNLSGIAESYHIVSKRALAASLKCIGVLPRAKRCIQTHNVLHKFTEGDVHCGKYHH
ncbi:Hypothetical predicted protein [Octopus vulgaris]|uniref:Uncharacterized protein n=1 Tax=Octopus vulgaris TaxID=6645 RepID=A0AA36F788_OCTVU|nr:Hypothetical predicted protein [Octopus vulgaris]